VLLGRDLIQTYYPKFDKQVATGLHIRRRATSAAAAWPVHAGDNAPPWRAVSAGIRPRHRQDRSVRRRCAGRCIRQAITADIIVNAAGPFAANVAAMHGERLPIFNVLQQKIAFADRNHAVDRRMPFAIDLDGQTLAWSDDEREALAGRPNLRACWRRCGSIHCRPTAAITASGSSSAGPSMRDNDRTGSRAGVEPLFPRSRAACGERLQPALAQYLAPCARPRALRRLLPDDQGELAADRAATTPGVFLATALSGYGTMGACAAGDLCARAVVGAPAPAFARSLSLARYEDQA